MEYTQKVLTNSITCHVSEGRTFLCELHAVLAIQSTCRLIDSLPLEQTSPALALLTSRISSPASKHPSFASIAITAPIRTSLL